MKWWRLARGLPRDADAKRSRAILLNANRYALVSWFPEGYGLQPGRYLDLGGTAEANIRPPAGEALGLAASLATGAYDERAVGVSERRARAVAVRLVASIAYRHRANASGGWGDAWQSALWAYYAGYAGWLLWDRLDRDDRERVRRMVEHEADRFVGYEVPYFRDEAGSIRFPGDSKAEENAWNANLLQLATAMMPRHGCGPVWMDKNLELMISAFSRPADVNAGARVNGRAVSSWLNGSNIADDGTLVNHGFIHPDYMATFLHNANAALSYSLAGVPTPEAAFWNAALVYDALVDLPFASPPYRPPGGTIYVDGSPDLYYPQGNDWGTHRRMHAALLDAQAGLLGFDDRASTRAPEWEALHGGMVLDMQRRFPDGRTYGAASEDTYAGREQWVAAHAAQAWLTHWLTHQRAFRVTDRAYPAPPPDTGAGTVAVDGPRYFAPGDRQQVAVTFANGSGRTALGVELALAVPEGWTIEPATDTTAGSVPAGGELTARWTVGAPADATARPVELDAAATFRSHGCEREVEASRTAWVPPAAPAGSPWLSELEWLEAVNGYGPVKRDTNYIGAPLTIDGATFDRGLWTNAPASISYYLGGACTSFTASVGIDDYVAAWGAERGSVTFQVFADGEKLHDTGLMTGTSGARPISVDVSGAQDLRLVATDGGDGKSYDHADWGGARLLCEPDDGAAPKALRSTGSAPTG